LAGAASVGPEVRGGFEPGLAAGPHGAAQRIRLERQRAKRDAALGVAAHMHPPAVEHEVSRRGVELAAREVHDFLATRTAAAWQALPATTAPRLANVPVPQ